MIAAETKTEVQALILDLYHELTTAQDPQVRQALESRLGKLCNAVNHHIHGNKSRRTQPQRVRLRAAVWQRG